MFTKSPYQKKDVSTRLTRLYWSTASEVEPEFYEPDNPDIMNGALNTCGVEHASLLSHITPPFIIAW